MKNKGKVYLLGAGPGDPDLFTLRGAQLLKEADAVVYDGLVHPKLLEWAPQAEKFFVGKVKWKNGLVSPKQSLRTQKEIFQIIQALVNAGKRVVRLKGGDPFVFGRGGEEAEFLSENQISFEVIPGISAGYAVPAYAGVPVTDRRFASTVVFAAGHEDPEKETSDVNWEKVAGLGGTLVFFMAVKNMGKVVQKLIEGKCDQSLPVCVIENGTLPSQRVVQGTLKTISKQINQAKIHSPSLMVVGKVVNLRKRLNWFQQGPLAGRRIVVLRPVHQAQSLVLKLQHLGAEVFSFPAIQILPPKNWISVDLAIDRIKEFDWIIFTSVNGIEFFWERMKSRKLDSRLFAHLKIAVIGSATLEALEKKGLCADLCPEAFTSKALFEEFRRSVSLSGKKILLARAENAPDWVEKAFQEEGAVPFRAVTYRTIADTKSLGLFKKVLGEKKIDWVVLTSASAAEAFLSSIKGQKTSFGIASIGPVTSETIRQFKYKSGIEAFPHNDQGIVDALIDAERRKK